MSNPNIAFKESRRERTSGFLASVTQKGEIRGLALVKRVHYTSLMIDVLGTHMYMDDLTYTDASRILNHYSTEDE